MSMPFFGLTPFLQHDAERSEKNPECVNALLRAYSISTTDDDNPYQTSSVCQCPSSGLLHFYERLEQDFEQVKNSVNALLRAYSISTVAED